MQHTDPISQASLDANRANAQRSTGPTTPEGKARASQNARTHGLTSTRIHFDNPVQQANYDELRGLQLVEHEPQTSSEQHLFEELVHSMWTIERVRILQSQLRDGDGLGGLETGEIPLQKQYDRLERYHTRAQNNWIRCRKLLKNLQNERIAKQTQAASPSIDELLEDLGKGASAIPLEPTLAAETINSDAGMTELERNIATLDPNDPQSRAKAEEMLKEKLIADLAAIAGMIDMS